jgi:hypothetical protein
MRDGDRIAVDAEAERLKRRFHEFRGYLSAKQPVDLLRLKLQRAGDELFSRDVDDAVNDFARAKQLHELAGALDGRERILRVEALFKAGGRIRAHTEGDGRLADGDALKLADSKTASFVLLVISLFSPPMTPATPTGLTASAMTSMPGVRARGVPSSVWIVSPGLAVRTTILRPSMQA